MKLSFFLLLFLLMTQSLFAQKEVNTTNTGMLSLGVRSTVSLFDHDGTGLGTGGQFRIRINDRINTDWYADYITINMDEGVRSTYYHIGWSVLYYPLDGLDYPKKIQPYILAGHCFDYNEKTVIDNPSISEDRWGSAIQAGLGSHFNISDRFDISLTSQYMIHLTKELEVAVEGAEIYIHEHEHRTLEGHLLTTLSLNYKLHKLWGK